MDRMITMDISFTDPDGKPIDSKPSGGSHIRFIHSANSVSLSRYAKYTFGYVSPKLLDAMTGMRAGGTRVDADHFSARMINFVPKRELHVRFFGIH